MPTSSDLNQTMKDHASDLGRQAKDTAGQHAVAHAEQAKDAAAEHVQRAANAADAAATQLDPASPQAQAVQQVADHIEDVAQKIRDADIRELAGNVSDMARRHPMLFIGGAAIAGFAAARFLKARNPQPAGFTRGADPWGTYPHGNGQKPNQHGADTSVMTKLNEEPNHG